MPGQSNQAVDTAFGLPVYAVGPGVQIGNPSATRVALPLVDRGFVAASTSYNAWDVVLLTNGFRVVFLQPAVTGGTSFVSATGSNGTPNYFILDYYDVVPSFLTGVRGDGNQATAAANTLAIASAFSTANNDGANAKGRIVTLPPGVAVFGKSVVDGSAAIHVPNGCGLVGQGRIASYVQLANGANCSVIRIHTSSGGSNPNAFFCLLRDFGIDARAAFQGTTVSDVTITATSTTIASATAFVLNDYVVGPGIPPDTKITVAGTSATMSNAATATFVGTGVAICVPQQCFSIWCRTNPLTTGGSGDWSFDPSHTIDSIYIKNSLHSAIRIEGRGGSTVRNVLIEHAQEQGIVSSFDMKISDCNIGFTGWDGIVLTGSSISLGGNKTYNCGQETLGTGIYNAANGLKATGITEIVGTHDSQQCAGSGIKFISCTGINLVAVSAEPGFNGIGQPVLAGAYAIELDGCTASIFHISGKVLDTGRGYRIVNATDTCALTYSHKISGAGAAGPAESADTVRLNNFIMVNGTFINSPGLTSATMAFPSTYGRISATGGWYNAGAGASAISITPTANTMVVAMLPLPRIGMVAQEVSIRVYTLGAGSSMRVGLYTSDLSGNDTFALGIEATAAVQFDTSTTGVKTITPGAPYTIAGQHIWTAAVSQGGTPPIVAANRGGVLLSSGNSNPLGSFGYNVVGVAGALPATAFAPNTQPVSVADVIAVGVRITG